MTDAPLTYLYSELPEAADCAENRVLLGRHLTAGLGADKARRFREHLLHCEACRGVYRHTLGVAARTGQGLRLTREEEGRATSAGVPRPRRLARVLPRTARSRLFAVVAARAALVVLARWSAPRTPTVEFRCLAGGVGEVSLAGAPVRPEDAALVAPRGAWCATRGGGLAALEGAGAKLRLGPETRLLLEELEGLRVRLEQGQLVADGTCAVVTPLGVAEVRGRTEFALADGVLRASCASGALVFTDASGSCELGPGQTFAAELGRDPLGGP